MAKVSQSTVEWVNRRVAEYASQGVVPGDPAEKKTLADWHRNRPQMLHHLKAAGIAEKMSFVVNQLYLEQLDKYVKAGMPPTDAREQAAKDWLMLGPEEIPEV